MTMVNPSVRGSPSCGILFFHFRLTAAPIIDGRTLIGNSQASKIV
jgi:hypothetical protein